MKKPGARQILIQACRAGTTMSTFRFWHTLEGYKILFLSPHPDDLALCIGGTLADKSRNCTFTVIDFFTRSVYAPNLRQGQRNEGFVSKKRLQEEHEYCSRYGVEVVSFAWPDSSLRGYSHEEETKGTPAHDKFGVYTRRALEQALAQRKPDLIFSPLAVGNHIDHSIVLWALKNAKKPDVPTIYYEDLPYVNRIELDAIDQVVQPILEGPGSIRIDITPSVEEKLKSLQIYKSTLTQDDLLQVRQHAGRLALKEGVCFERLWLSTKSSAPLRSAIF